MKNQKNKNKLIFLGDLESINIELVIKSFDFLKYKVRYILICNKYDFLKSIHFKKSNLLINEILDPINFNNYKINQINIFNIENISRKKYVNLLNQIKISNNLANITKFDLITMPINKSIFKKEIKFIGMTEYLGKLNKNNTFMLMHGDKFSIIPMTTHINLKNISRYINTKIIDSFLKKIFLNIDKTIYKLNFRNIKFICYNPHCSEEGTMGDEDIKIGNVLKKYNKIKGPYPGDSIFKKIKKDTLFISTYHDQALIPFKILNKKSVNITLGLNYRRISPAHGTARDIKNKFIADNSSYLKCLLF